LPPAQISVGSEVLVCGHHHAACDAKLACQCSCRRQYCSGRQAPLLDRRAQLKLQLRGQTPSAGPIEGDE
jgi:hypothetical protein